MPLPVPNLDDRRFQELVDDAKRLVQRRCPRMDRPQRLRPRRHLDRDLCLHGGPAAVPAEPGTGTQLRQLARTDRRAPVSACRGPGTGHLLAFGAECQSVVPHPGRHRGGDRADRHRRTRSLHGGRRPRHRPCSAAQLGASGCRWLPRLTGHARAEEPSSCASIRRPQVGDALLVGLSDPVPRCAVAPALRLRAVEGVGDRPGFPPLRWEAWNGADWTPARWSGTRPAASTGPVTSFYTFPDIHAASVVGTERAGWLSGRRTSTSWGSSRHTGRHPGSSASRRSPWGHDGVVHAQVVDDEILGTSDHVAGQSFVSSTLQSFRAGTDRARGDGRRRMAGMVPVTMFADSGPEDRHYLLDERAGEVMLGPAVASPTVDDRVWGRSAKGSSLAHPLLSDRWRSTGQRLQGRAAGYEVGHSIHFARGDRSRRQAVSTARLSRRPSCVAPS